MARYILDHGEQVSFMTAKQLAEAIGQSDAAVIRFAKAMGYAGYPALRESLRAGLLERAGVSKLPQTQRAHSSDDLIHQVIEADKDIILQTAHLNTAEKLTEVADLLINARRVYVTGHGTSFPLASYLAMQLSHCIDKGEIFNLGNGDIADRIRSVTSEDVFIGIGYLRYLPYTPEILKAAKRSGAQIIALTDRASSPLAIVSDKTLYVSRDVSSAAWWSQIGTLSLINWIITLVLDRDPETAEKKLRASDDLLKSMGHWEKAGTASDELSLEKNLIAKRSAAEIKAS
jgi:DNA-binding MurR/RpiR family transcriptional regulator